MNTGPLEAAFVKNYPLDCHLSQSLPKGEASFTTERTKRALIKGEASFVSGLCVSSPAPLGSPASHLPSDGQAKSGATLWGPPAPPHPRLLPLPGQPEPSPSPLNTDQNHYKADPVASVPQR